mmetsp:Transcript_305/g.782  ORF Transcript_305/g.782 Transcript_305/m.782 type:complete len:227 (-) Transcript_305:966-1646(-)
MAFFIQVRRRAQARSSMRLRTKHAPGVRSEQHRKRCGRPRQAANREHRSCSHRSCSHRTPLCGSLRIRGAAAVCTHAKCRHRGFSHASLRIGGAAAAAAACTHADRPPARRTPAAARPPGARPHEARFCHSRPKPVQQVTAMRSSTSSFCRDTYSGSRSVLKQVWLVGSFPLSGPLRCTMQRSRPRPPMGARSDPVKNFRNLRFSSKSSSCLTISHSQRTTGVPAW